MLKQPLEADIQIAIVEAFSLLARKRFMFHSIPNERVLNSPNAGGMARLNKLKKMGLLPGCADLEVVCKGQAYYMEVKRPRETLSMNQRYFRQNAQTHAAGYAMVHDADEAIDALKIWGII